MDELKWRDLIDYIKENNLEDELIFKKYSKINKKDEMVTYKEYYYEFDNVEFDEYIVAENVMFTIIDIYQKYGVVYVSDLYELSGITAQYLDSKFGWSNLEDIGIICLDNKRFMIKLPEPKLINKKENKNEN